MNDNPAQNAAPNIDVEKERSSRMLKAYACRVAIVAIVSSAIVLIMQPTTFALMGVMFIMLVSMIICLALLVRR